MDKSVIELFAGVGGFRVGLNKIRKFDKNGLAIENKNFRFVWMNQWEPSTKIQHAFECYKTRFGGTEGEISNIDIALVNKKTIPNHSLLCGGFPCQDYSVARSLSKEKGIEGKKGVLWWQIEEILKVKKTPFVLLENVDRLLKSPSKQRGRDFAIMLKCFDELNYSVEWRVINAAEYGYPQRRRRVYIFAYKNTTKYAKKINKLAPTKIIDEEGVFSKGFKVEKIEKITNTYDIRNPYHDLVDLSNSFKGNFENSGILLNGIIYTVKTSPILIKPITLKKIIMSDVDSHYYLSKSQLDKFAYLRGAKKVLRTSKGGLTYYYSEGSMSSVDDLNSPGRTMLTSEGSINRSSHIIDDPKTNKRRILTPIECERLNQFPDNWTNTMLEKRRYFMMGNALVCGVIEKIGDIIAPIIEEE